MKPLESMNNVERAKLLHSLFPQDISASLQFVKGMCMSVQEDPEPQRKNWGDSQLFSFDFWLTLAQQVARVIDKYGKQLEKSSSLFSDQLFDGYNAMFMAHCLIVYTITQQHPNRKFSIAVDMLFNS